VARIVWTDDTVDVHMVIHSQWITSDMSGSARTGLRRVTLCTQLWMDLWTNVHEAADGLSRVSDGVLWITARWGR